MKRLFNPSPLNTGLAALLLRLFFGGMFVYIGYQKLSNYDTFAPMFPDLLHIGGKLSLGLVIFAEFGCGLLVLIGLLTRLAVIPICFTMIVAFFMAHAKDPYDAKQLPLLFLLLTIVIFVLGSGRYSVDGLFFGRKKRM